MKRISQMDLLRYAPDLVFITEPDGRIIFVNDNAVSVTGYTSTELQTLSVLDLAPPDWREAYRLKLLQVAADGERHLMEMRLITKTQQKIPMDLHVVRMPNGLLYGTCRDISERKRNAAKLAEAHKHLSDLIEAIPDPIFFKDGEGRWLILNQPAKKLFNLEAIDWQGKTDMELAELQPEMLAAYESCVRDDRQAWDKGGMVVTEELIPHASGELHTYEVLKMPTYKVDGQRRGLVIIGRDITEHKLSQQRINELAFYDPLTMLPNRRLLLDRLNQALSASEHSKLYGAVIFVDLDHFKVFGSADGDALLREIAHRLTACTPEGDTVACLGGDMFVIIMSTLSTNVDEAADQAQHFTETVRDVISQPYQIGERVLRTTASIGVALLLGRQEAADALLKQAKSAMEEAKKAEQNNGIHFYNPQIQASLQARNELETELRTAIEQEQFRLFYQVQIDSQQNALGAEVLLRWEHPVRGLLTPYAFISLCEETGLIVPLGKWVLEQACKQLKQWQKNPRLRNLLISVNVSAKQFHQKDFVAQVQQVLLESGAKPAQLKLELTESSMLTNIDDTVSKMRSLQAMGLRFSIDDFGTGHSSLQYLKRLPLDQLKIDQSFVRDITTDPNDAVIVKTIISMSDALGLNVIAEGVETQEQRDFLDSHGCHVFQGYLFGRPVSLDEFERSIC